MAKKRLYNLIEEVWSSVSDSQISVADDADHPGVESLEWLVKVPIGGEHNNKSVVLGVAEEVGRELAADMFGKSPQQLSDSDIEDAVGEIANMIAEGIKVLLGSSESIGLPQSVSKQLIREQLQRCEVKTDLFVLSAQRYIYVAVMDCTLIKH